MASGDNFYRSKEWKALRLRILTRDHYFCQECKRKGRPFVPANTVHHIKPREKFPELAMDESNLESVCPMCHNKAHPEKAFKKYQKKKAAPKGVRIIKM